MNEESIFQAALEKSTLRERIAYLDSACQTNPELRRRVEAMLQQHALQNPLTGRPAPGPDHTVDLNQDAMEAGLSQAFPAAAVVFGKAGDSVLKALSQTIDVPRVALRETQEENADASHRSRSSEVPVGETNCRYSLDGEIARGGMGAILKGRDTDLGRDLAIKVLLDQHKDKPEVIQRFVEEAQIGGQLQHPGIAPVYELGQFSDQRPYFSMKLVKGQTLSKLLAERNDAAEDRGRFIAIFEQVCQTMAYAHSRGVIHRDLKPANIMVGAFGEVQVMDWGLAKVLSSDRSTDGAEENEKQQRESIIQTMRHVAAADSPDSTGLDTQIGSVMGTPAYMPPEQALGKINQVDQRADLFGLGAILCEILTSQPPYVSDDAASVFRLASLGKLDECIQRLDGCGAPQELIAVTKNCLALDLADRPLNAGVLAGRITGFLESVETKLRETELERARQTARVVEQQKRFRVTLALATTVLLALLGGIAGTGWQAHRAEEARVAEAKRAEGERLAKLDAQGARDKAEEAAAMEQAANAQAQKRLMQVQKANEILGSIFENLDPSEIAKNERPLQAILVDKLDSAVAEIEGNAIGNPLVVAGMQARFGSSLFGLGEAGKAIQLFEKAWATQVDLLGADHAETLANMHNLALAYLAAGQLGKALPLLEETLKLTKAKVGPEHPSTLICMNSLAGAYDAAGQLDKAMPLFEETLRLRNAELGAEHPVTLNCMDNLANAYMAASQLDKALPLLEATLQLRKVSLGPEHPDTLICMNSLAGAYSQTGRLDKALPLLEKTLKLSKARLGLEHPTTLLMVNNLASVYLELNRVDEALPLQEESLQLMNATLGPEHPDTLTSMNNLAAVYWRLERFDKSIPLLEEVIIRSKELAVYDAADSLRNVANLGVNYRDAGRLDAAIPLLEQAYEASSRYPKLLWVGRALFDAYVQAGETTKLSSLVQELVSDARESLPEDSPALAGLLAWCGKGLLVANAYSEAEPLLRESVAIRKQKLPDSWLTYNAHSLLGGALLGQQKYAEAEPLLLKGCQGMNDREQTIPAVGTVNLTESLERLVDLFEATGQKEEAAKWQAVLEHRQATLTENNE